MSLRAAAATALLLSLAACGGSEKDAASSGNSALMRPGENCNAAGCHAFTAAGTVFAAAGAGASEGVAGATVTIAGDGAPIVLTTNGAGNFHTTQPFGSAATMTVAFGGQSRSMRGLVTDTDGACGRCHAAGARVVYHP